MTFQAYIENLKAKPEHVRRRIAFWSSFGITAIIFTFWLASFSITGTTAKSAVATVVTRAGSPAQSLIAGVGDFLVDVKEMIFGTKKINYAQVEVSGGTR
ncbi:MAG: hypothetical protein AAB470_01405 [Patescibacteria group bacterium]